MYMHQRNSDIKELLKEGIIDYLIKGEKERNGKSALKGWCFVSFLLGQDFL